MHKITLAFVAAASLFTVGACKKTGGANDAVAKMEGFAKEMCECKEKACGDKVNDSMAKWSQEMAKSAGKEAADSKPDPELATKMGAATTKIGDCYGKLATAAATPPADKTAPAATPPADKKPDEPAAATPPADKKADEPAAATPPADKKADDKKPDDKKSGGW